MADQDDPIIPDPTYLGNIRNFFRPMDIQHMAQKNIDIGTYDGVKENALDVFFQTQPPNAKMPPPEFGPQWSANRSQTFKNWITNGYPLGTATPTPTETPAPAGDAETRLRKNVASLSADEQEQIKAAFSGLMGRDPSASDSYYTIAGGHGKPKSWCMHHVNPFNPWHRAYLKIFEDALRTVPDCEDVTLPYWDINTDLPQLLQEDPLATYTLPADPGLGVPHYQTSRFAVDEIATNMRDTGGSGYSVLQDLAIAQTQSVWGVDGLNGYQNWSIQAHDGGHGSIGPTMGNQDVASYDPVFWFYHCNIDRLWLAWQIQLSATTLDGFKSVLGPGVDASWLSPPFNALRGLTATSDQTIGGCGASYDNLAEDTTKEPVPALENKLGSVDAARTFAINSSDPVSVRVKDIARLNIPGSFAVHLLADGEPIAKRFVFQRGDPQACETCQERPLVNLDFRIDREKLVDRKLSVEIEVPSQTDAGTRFPLSGAGNPTVNARLLLEDE
jgi:tyrosinase